MAKTHFATNNPLRKVAYEERLFRDSLKETYWQKFKGEGADSVIQVKTQLNKEQGDKIVFGIRKKLTGPGVKSGQKLEGNEEKLNTHDYSVELEQYRHAVRDDGAMTRKRAMFSIETESKDALKDWGTEKMDQLPFDALNDIAATRIFYKAGITPSVTDTPATAKAALTTSSKLTPDFLSFIRTWLTSGGNRKDIPIRPVKVNGKNHYLLLAPPDVLYDWRVDPTYQQALREAEVRGKENPIFTGAVAMWDGFVIHEHENVPTADDAGAGGNVHWAKCHVLGAQSMVWAWGEREKIVSKKFDYDNEHGHAWGFIAGVGVPVFDGKIYGSVAVYLAATNVSGLG